MTRGEINFLSNSSPRRSLIALNGFKQDGCVNELNSSMETRVPTNNSSTVIALMIMIVRVNSMFMLVERGAQSYRLEKVFNLKFLGKRCNLEKNLGRIVSKMDLLIKSK